MKLIYSFLLALLTLSVLSQVPTNDLQDYSTQKLVDLYKSPSNSNDIKIALSQELLTRKDLDEKSKIWVLSVYGPIQMYALDAENAIKNLEQAKSLALKYKDNDTRLRLMVICLNLAEAYYAIGDTKNSEKNLLEVKKLDMELPESPQKIQYMTDYNAFYYYKGDFEKYYAETFNNLQKTIEQKKRNTDKNLEDLYIITELAYRLVLLNVSILQNNRVRIDENFIEAEKLMKANASILSRYNTSDPYGNLMFFLSRYYTLKKEYEQALSYLKTAKDLGKANHNQTLYFISTVEEAKVNFLKGDYEKSLAAAKEGIENKAFLLDFFDYEMEAYRYAALSAEKLDLKDVADSYQDLFLTKNNSLKDQHKKELLSKVLTQNEIIEATAEKTKKNQLLTYLLYGGIFCLVTSIVFIFYNRNRNHKKIKNFQAIIAKLEENRQAKGKSKTENLLKADTQISDKTKQILANLNEFENGNLFLNKEMSLSTLAVHLNTNTSTLSAIINQYKQQNFNDYINGLRIDYLIEKFESDTTFRSYKLSHIAELCGFSSHPHLSSSFKKKTGITPSEFLKLLEESQNTEN